MTFVPVALNSISTINGFQLFYLSTVSILISPGQCFDSTNVSYINQTTTDHSTSQFGAATVVYLDRIGVNGLDQGAVAANTLYYIYVIDDPSNYKSPSFVLSASPIGPLLPQGYSLFRRIGAIYTDQLANIHKFIQSHSDGSIRTMQYINSINVLDLGSATTRTVIDLISVPRLDVQTRAGKVCVTTSFIPDSAGDIAFITAGSHTGTLSEDFFTITGQVASIPVTQSFVFVPGLATFSTFTYSTFTYYVSNPSCTLSVNVINYDDIL